MAGCGCNRNQIEMVKECPLCHTRSHPISYPAVKLVVKESLRELVIENQYFTCGNKECEVVFFDEEGEQVFLLIDVNLKADFKEITKDQDNSCGGRSCKGCGR